MKPRNLLKSVRSRKHLSEGANKRTAGEGASISWLLLCFLQYLLIWLTKSDEPEDTSSVQEKKEVIDPDYIEDQARKQLKMVKPGEILYILPDEDEKKDKE